MIKVFVLCFLLLIGSGAQGDCAQPLDDVQRPLDEIIRILKDPSYQNTSQKTVQREKIWKIVVRVFDFKEISRRTLARHWKNFSPEQQKEFTALYRTLLETVYMDRILMYTDEKIVFTKEAMLSKNRAEVQSKLIRSGTETPINYRMVLLDGNWKVYDVVIEGVSMVKNYRSQFKEILSKGSPEELLKTLREKVKKA